MKLKKQYYIQVSGDLFKRVQSAGIFNDSKTFVDAIPKRPPKEIEKSFKQLSKKKSFDLKKFVLENFILPEEEKIELNLPDKRTMEEHIELLWKYLERSANEKTNENSSLIPLPFPYIIPGGRFREIYYWDSYFTIQGLLVCGKIRLAENMLDNFSFLINKIGHIPNGNRIYYLTRSQPPFFAAMVDSVSKFKKDPVHKVVNSDWQLKYLDSIESEYKYWMKGERQSLKSNKAVLKVVSVNKKILNRYFDPETLPREESFAEDSEAAGNMRKKEKEKLFRHIRSAGESGWDFSSRWFEDKKSISKCIAADLLPVDLNSLLYFYEKKLAELYLLNNKKEKSDYYLFRSIKRRDLINRVFWDHQKKFYFDYNFKTKKLNNVFSLAACYPLFFEIADVEKAASVAEILKEKFLKPGGLVTTLNHTGQQWDAPNGWAPLQYIAIKGLKNYGFNKLANEIQERWLDLNRNVFNRAKKMFEKYNVENINLSGGGGEYPLQDGFGWTNGVAIALLKQRD